ncbi:UDP-glycosyltransferase 91A1-like isoform X1 [Nicotiana tomentosiformis]|uniref:UDP-glycosyltransferase 91A1-like isoform X1 n=1 Tax=Nicotiana tomentosiformis TaxID=4098 RepID=UPI00051C99E9|nr:UDP-glycosyltransferase 91A1-like [Nicotiana tomentosiformis]
MATENKKLHIAMVPWLAFGHMLPYLELAKHIALKGHKISFISTPRNIDRLPKLPPNISPFIRFVKIPLQPVENLPKDAEATTDLPYEKVQYLKIAYDALRDSIRHFLQTNKPDWIFFDFAAYWAGPIATELNISSAFFSIMIAAVLGFLGPAPVLMSGYGTLDELKVLTASPKWVNFPTTVAFRLYEVLRMKDSFTGNMSEASDIYRFGAGIKSCDVLLNRSCSEFEPEWLHLVEQIHRKPVFPVGQLSPLTIDNCDDESNGVWTGGSTIKQWLDSQEKGSVIYVAFGSEAKPSQEELTEIAHGLELSGLPFFWVLRKQRGEFDTDLIELPEGFEERTNDRGMVCTGWAPQLKILSHDSVGGFLTHSGWSSVVEALSYEKALILLPFLSDQGLNARLLEEKKMAYSIPRDEREGTFTRDSVANSLSLVMLEEGGKVYRENAKNMRELFADKGKQEKYVDNLMKYLQKHREIEKENGDITPSKES